MKKILSILLSILMLFTASSVFTSATTETIENQIGNIYDKSKEKWINTDLLDECGNIKPYYNMTVSQAFKKIVALIDNISSYRSRQFAALFINELRKIGIKNATYLIINIPEKPKYFAVAYKLSDEGRLYIADTDTCGMKLADYCNMIIESFPGTICQLLNKPPYEIHKLEKDLIKGEDYIVYSPEV